MCCIPDVVDAGEVVLGVDVDDAGGVVVVTPKTHTRVLKSERTHHI